MKAADWDDYLEVQWDRSMELRKENQMVEVLVDLTVKEKAANWVHSKACRMVDYSAG